jgi:hypothetical protein
MKTKRLLCSFLRLSVLLTGLVLLQAAGAPNASAGALERLFVPKADTWSFWSQSGEATGIDHAPWQQFLHARLHTGDDGISRVAYSMVTAAERNALRDYIHGLERIDIRDYRREEQLAFWINLYNAATVNLVLEHYPVASIRDIDISPGFFSFGPWDKKLLHIEGQELSLNDIEHRILRPLWREPRLHYALNCASLGCPNLQRDVFTAANMQALLDRSAREYVNHPRGVTIIDDDLHVSSIYNWFREDFGGSEADVIEHLRAYAQPRLAAGLAGFSSIDDDWYDWALNDTMPVEANPVTEDDFE